MQECSQHLPAHDHGAQHEYADMVSKTLNKQTLHFMLFQFSVFSFTVAKFVQIFFTTVSSFVVVVFYSVLFVLCFVFQGTDATSTTEDHRGCDEEAT